MEQRLIDADALEKKILKRGAYKICTDDVVAMIADAPTVDAVPVVRCKECRWACLAPQRKTATCMKKRLPSTHDYDFYCADGERKDGERRTDGNTAENE